MLRIAGQTAGPIGLNFFCGHSGVAEGCYLNFYFSKYFFVKFFFNFFLIFFFHGQRRALQLVSYIFIFILREINNFNFSFFVLHKSTNYFIGETLSNA